MNNLKPMLAGKADFSLLRYPLLASVKIDGLRCLIREGQAISRSGKLLPNEFLQNWAGRNASMLDRFDGELVIGPINAPDCYRRSVSGIMSEDGEPDFTYWVFDLISDEPYDLRSSNLRQGALGASRVQVLAQHEIRNAVALDMFEAKALSEGHEGIMLRDPHGYYKHGRATTRGGELLKVKRFEDAEATVVGVEEEMHNANEAKLDELGHTKRSSHAENKVGKGVLGALIVEGLTAYPGIKFRIGTGFDAEMRANLWRQDLVGKVVKFKHFPIGAKEAPRHPVFLGWRDPNDIGNAA